MMVDVCSVSRTTKKKDVCLCVRIFFEVKSVTFGYSCGWFGEAKSPTSPFSFSCVLGKGILRMYHDMYYEYDYVSCIYNAYDDS